MFATFASVSGVNVSGVNFSCAVFAWFNVLLAGLSRRVLGMLRVIAFGLIAYAGVVGAAQAACTVSTGSTLGATMLVTGTGAGHVISLCVSDPTVTWGLFGSSDGVTNPNIDAYNNLPMSTGGFTFPTGLRNITVTTAKGNYTLSPQPNSNAATLQYDITVNSFSGTGSDTITLWYANQCSSDSLSPNYGCGSVSRFTNTPFVVTLNLPAAPTVTGISPAAGPTTGGTAVTITGTDFTGATAVTVGGVAATGITVVNNTTITATTASHAAGTVNVVVTTPAGTGTGTNLFTYAAAPTVAAILPTSGPAGGGTSVVITGTNLSNATAVMFGATAATSVQQDSATQVTATSPAGSGLVDVTVTTPGGTSATSAADQYTYIAAPTVSSISPVSGPAAGGTFVTISGTNLTGATAVTIGGTAPTGITVVNATTITATTAVHAAGTVDVVVTTPGGTGTGTNLYTYVAAPTVNSISPVSGPAAGGTFVTISGTNLTGATAVTIGGTAPTGITVVNATTITATTAAHAAGTVDVVVTTPGGTGTGTNLYTYIAAPTVVSVTPPAGPLAGSTSVTISGTNFTGATAATGVTVVNATTITALTPAHAAGAVDVIVTTPGGTGTGTNLYTYTDAPTVASVTPAAGPVAGGTSVTITGTNFTGATAVAIGGVAITSLTVVNATTITGTTGAHVAGVVNVVVTAPGGTGTGNNLYTYFDAPTVASITPAAGPIAGGTNVTIFGTSFLGATAVTIGGAALTGMTVVNASTITGTTPAHAAGSVDVVVTTPGGIATGTNLYTYSAAPTVASIAPSAGPITGGTSVTITGTNFAGTTSVTVGGGALTGVTISATTITGTTSAHAAGVVDVVVTTPGGTATGTNLYTYSAAPTVASITPASGPVGGGTAVTITGSNFSGATAVTIGGVAVTSLTVANATTITATTSAHAAGVVDVVVTAPGGSGTGVGLFTYASAPTVASIAPSAGPITGGTVVTITGINFTGATGVTIGGAALTAMSVVNPTTITGTTSAHAAGSVDVIVTTPGGSGTGSNLYTYSAAPTVTAIAPTVGSIAGGTAVTITGTNFTGATAVAIGGGAATGVTVVSATTITATTPAHAAGAVDVVVTTPGGIATATGIYTYSAVPTVTSVAPNSGSSAGGTAVTISGSNFTAATGVTFGGTAATGVTVVNATTITATTPAHAAGVVDIVVAGPGGSGTGSNLFTYAIPATTTTLASSKNPSEAGQAVTFTAVVSANGAPATGTVTFNDGGVAIGSAILAGGIAAVTTTALQIGNHAITAAYAGNASFLASTSAPLVQSVNTPQDSLKLRAMQIIASKAVSQTSGSAISGSIDAAISEGFSDGGNLVSPSAGGMRINFSADPDRADGDAAATTVFGDRWNGVYGFGPAATGVGGSNGQGRGRVLPSNDRSRIDNAFAAIDRMAVKSPASPGRSNEPKDWLLWADIKGAGISRWGSSSAVSALYGNQVNALLGLTRRLTPNFLVGVVGGYEIFDYRSDTLNGRLKGDGWTLGSYAAWKMAAGLRIDGAVAYSGIGYDGTAGIATGSFNGDRWLLSGGVTGTMQAYGFAVEPSARVYALWEHQNAYTDSLRTPQDARDFFTGRASVGANVSYPWLYSAMVTLVPYAGVYADYYFVGDDAATVTLAGAAPLASVPLLDGWSARATGGLGARFANGTSLVFGAELGGLGSSIQIWTFRGRASVPF